MPLYEYECEACGHRFEVIQKFSDPPIDKCPRCGSPVHKLQSAPAFQFKGTGWYVTDYAKSGSSDGKTAKDSQPADGASAGSGSSDKPASSDAGAASTPAAATTTPPASSGGSKSETAKK
jgi:putative FmdB family regulatory protein